jgi:hypothetical protein
MTSKAGATVTAIAIWIAIAAALHRFAHLSPHPAEIIALPIMGALALWTWTGRDSSS